MVEIIAFAVFGVVALGAVIALALKWGGAEGRVADFRVADEHKAGQLAIKDATITTWTDKANSEERRADALDKELDQVAADGDVAGARERVLARWKRQAGGDSVPPAGGGAGSVPQVAPTGAAVDRDALEPPTG